MCYQAGDCSGHWRLSPTGDPWEGMGVCAHQFPLVLVEGCPPGAGGGDSPALQPALGEGRAGSGSWRTFRQSHRCWKLGGQPMCVEVIGARTSRDLHAPHPRSSPQRGRVHCYSHGKILVLQVLSFFFKKDGRKGNQNA